MHPDADPERPVPAAQYPVRPVPSAPPSRPVDRDTRPVDRDTRPVDRDTRPVDRDTRPVDRDTVVDQLEHAVTRLDGLADLPVAEHVTRFEAAHAALTEALSSIDRV